jgi:hypothetical protein
VRGRRLRIRARSARGIHADALRLDIPEPDEICKACRQSDAKYGKGDIPNVYRWDR